MCLKLTGDREELHCVTYTYIFCTFIFSLISGMNRWSTNIGLDLLHVKISRMRYVVKQILIQEINEKINCIIYLT